ncbi:MAG: hypothetical protein V1742_02930, partial [Pseudomonadota bacterium]
IAADERGGGTVNKIKAKDIQPLESALENMARAVVFKLSALGKDRDDLMRLKSIVESHPGQTTAVLKLNVPGHGTAVMRLLGGVRPTRSLLREAREALGENGVTVTYH